MFTSVLLVITHIKYNIVEFDVAISRRDSDAENVRRALDKQCKG